MPRQKRRVLQQRRLAGTALPRTQAPRRQMPICGRRGVDTTLHVDHIKPRRRYPELELDDQQPNDCLVLNDEDDFAAFGMLAVGCRRRGGRFRGRPSIAATGSTWPYPCPPPCRSGARRPEGKRYAIGQYGAGTLWFERNERGQSILLGPMKIAMFGQPCTPQEGTWNIA
jgi:hypothetical protein